MFKHVKKTESQISVELEELLTGDGCTLIVIELIKYIMYQKQQIPLACDSLMKLHSKSQPTDKNFKQMQNLVDSLCNVNEQLASQFVLDNCDIKEVVIVIGATIASPKVCIRIELPSVILDSNTHHEYHHSSRKPLLNLMRSIFECPEFQQEMTVPLGLTNTFVLVQKRDPRQISKFFIPKPQFNLTSQNATSFHIKLHYNEDSLLTCNCENSFKIYNDSQSRCTNKSYVVEKSNCESETCYEWYQSKEVFKGFKFLR